MPVEFSEKKLLTTILLLVAGLYLFFTSMLVPAPIYVSEKGILVAVAALLLIRAGIKMFSRSSENG